MTDQPDNRSGDELFTAFQHANLNRAAKQFNVTVTGSAHLGWKLRSISAPAHSSRHGNCWLKVTSEFGEYAHGDDWTGTTDAEALNDTVPKPRLLDDTLSWDDKEYWRTQRAELTTLITDQPSTDIQLPNQWWTDLTHALTTLEKHPTDRRRVTPGDVAHRLNIFFGDRANPHADNWTTAHGDLHWGNITAPHLSILDWELWGLAPAGYDAATLLCFSLNNTALTDRIKQQFAAVLGTPSGTVAQLDVITRLLLRANNGDHPNLVVPLHHHAQTLLHHQS